MGGTMKLEVDRRALDAALGKVAGAVGNKSNMPILSNVLLDFDGTYLELSATDLEISIRTRIIARGIDKGRTTVSAKQLAKISTGGPANTVEMELDENQTKLLARSGKLKCELPVIAPEDFPYINVNVGKETVKFDPFTLTRAFERIDHAVASDKDSFTMPGVYLHRVDDKFRAVASDGHRCVYCAIDESRLPGLEIGEMGIIIPGSAVRLIVSVLKPAQNAQLEVGGNRLLIHVDDTSLACQLMDGEFPEYQVIYPVDPPYHIDIPREDMAAVLKRLAGFAIAPYIHVRMIVTELGIDLQTGTPNIGAAEDFLAIPHDGETFQTALNIAYLRETLAASHAEKISFEWVDQNHGLVFNEVGNDDVSELIMPMVI